MLLTPDWSGVLDATSTCRYQLRLTREDILEGTRSIFAPSDVRLAPARAEQQRTGSFRGTLRLLPKDGDPFEATVSVEAGSPATGKGDGPQDLAVLTYDTERRVPLEVEETWSRHPLHHSPDVVALYDVDGTLRYISPSVVDVLGWTPEEMTGQVTMSLVHPDDVEAMVDAFLVVAEATGPPRPVVFRVLHKAGGWRHLEVMLKDLSKDPDVGGSTVHFRDITDRVEELSASYFEGLSAADGDAAGGIANLTPEGRPVRLNDRFTEIVGRSREDLLDLGSLDELLHPEDRDAYRSDLRQVAEGATSVAERRLVRSDGTVAWVTWKVQRPVRNGVASDLLVVSVEDVSARKEAEDALALLTPRERETLVLVCRGLDNSAIAREMVVSVHTVKHHVQALLRKLGVPDRRRAAQRVAALHPLTGSGPQD